MKKLTDKINVDQLAEMFELFDWESLYEYNIDYLFDAGAQGYEEAIKEDATEDEAEERRLEFEQGAEKELYSQWYNGVTGAADRLFEEHDLELLPIGHTNRPHEFKIVPSTPGQAGWRKAAAAIMRTINGAGYFTYEDLNEFLDLGSYTPRQAVLSRLGWTKYYSEVYGAQSAESIYERAFN